MWTLIKREIRDQWLHIALPFIIIIIALMSLVSRMLWIYKKDIPVLGLSDDLLALYWIPMVITPLLAANFGVTQIYADRSRKISAFLLSQPTSRPQLLLAKVITGLLWVLCVTVPFILTDVIILTVMPPLIPGETIYLIKFMVTAVLINLTCYTIGLMRGWGTNKYLPALSAVALSLPLLVLLIIKGFGIETWAILILVTVAALIKMIDKFMATSL